MTGVTYGAVNNVLGSIRKSKFRMLRAPNATVTVIKAMLQCMAVSRATTPAKNVPSNKESAFLFLTNKTEVS